MALGWGDTMADKTMGRGLAKWLILLALVPIAGPPLPAQSKDQPDQGFGPIDTSAPTIPPDKIVQQFAAKEVSSATLWTTIPTSGMRASRPSTMTAKRMASIAR